ncbi:MAG: glutamate synthase subunit beta, partial [Planctomycetia bacterium]
MGDPRGFMKFERKVFGTEPVDHRLKNYNEFLTILPADELKKQGARCMDCGVPFCHTGCPLGNIIPDFNDLVYRDQWHEASQRLHATNNFPEFTGRVCPAPCEAACVLGINEDPVAIKSIEMSIADRAFDEGWVIPEPPAVRSGKRVAVVGSGPAGLAATQQLNRAGHLVTLFERADRPGGLLMYGIPDFKLEKWRVWRRIRQMEEEGVEFRCGVNVGTDVSTQTLRDEYDAIVLTGGATLGRDLPIPGRQFEGVHYAMDFLPQQNKRNAGDAVPGQISAEGKDVIVIGGGDTGSDCDGTSNRQGCKSLTQFELLPQPPDLGKYPRRVERPAGSPWPLWTQMLRTSSSHEEGCRREWSILTKEFLGDDQGRLRGLQTVRIEWYQDPATGQQKFKELPGTEEEWPCQ